MIVSILISIAGLLFLLLNSILFLKTIKGKDKSYKFLTLYLGILFSIELICHIIGIMKPNSNFFLSHYYFNIQFIVLSFFFTQLFNDKALNRLVYLCFCGVVVILAYQYYNNPSIYWQFNVLEITLTSSILILYCAIYFYKHLKTTYNYFFFCFGLTFYLISSMLIFLSGNTTLVFFESPFYMDIWVFNSLFYILFQFMIYKEWRVLNNKAIFE